GEFAGRHGPARIVVLRKLVVVVGRRVAGAECKRGQREQQPAQQPGAEGAAANNLLSRARGLDQGSFRRRAGERLGTGPADKETSILQRGQLQPSSCKGFAYLPSEYTKGRLPRRPASGGLVLACNLA